MNKLGPLPWELTFSYGRALAGHGAQGLGRQRRELRRRPEGVQQAREAQRPRATGRYEAEMENQAA